MIEPISNLSILKGTAFAVPLLFVFTLFLPDAALTQNVLTEAQAIQSAMQYHPMIKSADFAVEEKRNEQKSSVSFQNPTLTLQSPSGKFYTVGGYQNFDFPTVYSSQNKIAKAEVGLAEKQRMLTGQELAKEVRNAYIESRYAFSKWKLMADEDSIFSQMQTVAQKKYEAGEIDFVEKSSTELKYGDVHARFIQSLSEWTIAKHYLMSLCGITQEILVDIWTAEEFEQNTPFINDLSGNGIWIDIAKKESEIANRQVALEKGKAMPGFQIGYQNQGFKDTPINLRWQAGITIPIWFWQYHGKIKAAKARESAASENEKSVMLQFDQMRIAEQNRMISERAQLEYYTQKALVQSTKMEEAAMRFFNAGEYDFPTYLGILNDAVQVKLNFIETMKSFSLSEAQWKYLNGINE